MPEAAPVDDAPAYAHRAARTLGEPQSGHLVARVPHETDQGRQGAIKATHTPLANASGRLSQPVLRPPSRGRAERSRTCIATRSRIWAPLLGLRAPRHIVSGVRDEWFCTVRGVGNFWGAPALLMRAREPCLGSSRKTRYGDSHGADDPTPNGRRAPPTPQPDGPHPAPPW